MSLIRIDRNPSRGQLAVFGVLWFLFLAVIGSAMFARGGPRAIAIALLVAAVAVPAIGCVAPGLLRLVYLGMAYLAFPIGFVVSHLLIAVVYYAVLTPIGLLMRLFGHDPMKRSFDGKTASYWTTRQQPQDVRRYFRQF